MNAKRAILSTLLAGALALGATAGGTVDAAVSLKQVGGSGRVMLDMTPDGRYVLLREDGPRHFRIDRRTGTTKVLPWLDDMTITGNGAYVFGIDPDTYDAVRYEVASGRRKVYPLPHSQWLAAGIAVSADGSRIGVSASWPQRTESGLFYINTGTRAIKRIDTLARGLDPRRGEGSISISADGRVMSFSSSSVAGAYANIYVYRRATDRVSLASPSYDGGRQPTDHSGALDLSGDGRFVLFWSKRGDLVEGFSTHVYRYYLRDLRLGRTIRVRVPVNHIYGPWQIDAALNHDGSRIAVPIDGKVRANGQVHDSVVAARYDRNTGALTRVMKTTDGRAPSDGLFPSANLMIDAFGVQVGFSTYATNLVNSRGSGVRSYVARIS